MFETFPLPPHALDTFQCGQAEARHFRRLHIWGNGSCFFHSVAALLVYRNKVQDKMITYYLAIPTNQNLVKADEEVHHTTPAHTVHLAFHVPNRYPADKFYHNFEQIGIQLRQYLSQTITQPRFAQFLNHAFTTEMKDILTTDAPDWITVKKELASPSKWANIWTVKYAAWALSLNLLFINGTSREEPIFCGVENFNRGPWTLFIFWSGKVHFEPIVELKTETSAQIKQRVFQTSHSFINCLQQRFESAQPGGCKIQINT